VNPWKWIALILLAVALALGASLVVAHFRLAASDKIVEQYVSGELTRQGYVPGRYKKPTIDDAPVGSKPVAHLDGTVHYPPKSGSPTLSPTITPAPEAAHHDETAAGTPQTLPCSLDDLDISVRCVADLLAETTKPWARLVTSGTISGWGQVRELPTAQAGTLTLEIAPTIVPPTWRLDLLAGLALGSRQGVEFGASWTGRTRLGGYLLAEWQPATTGSIPYYEGTLSTGEPATWRLHGGVRVRVK